MEYNTLSHNREPSNDSGLPKNSLSSDAREEDQTYVKNAFPGNPPSPMLGSYSPKSEPALAPSEMNYNEVKLDVNTSQYFSGQKVPPRTAEPNYVTLHPKPDNPVNMDIGDVIKQAIAAGQEKNPNSSVVIHIGNVTINNAPDPTYYGHVTRPPPEPCLPHQYHDVGQPGDDHLRRKSLSTSEEEMYIGIPGNRTPVEHSGTEQPSLIVDDHIDPYRETQNFLIQSRPNSTRSQHTQSSPQTEQRDAEPVKPHGPEGNPTQMTIHPRHSPDGSLEKFDVQLVRQGSNQRWTCELKPSQTSKSHSRSPSIDTLDTDVTYDSHRQARDRNRPTVPLTLESAGTLQPTERWPNTDPSYKTTFNEDRRLPYCGDDNTLVKEISSPVGEELCRHIGQRVTYVENPVYMADQPFRSTNNLTSSVNTQNMLGYSGEMEPSRPGVHMNTVVGRSMSQSAPDIRQVTPFPPQTTRRPTVFPNKLKTRGHACVVHGYFNIHDEKAIEDAKKRLETDGEDGNWLVTLAIRQPMHSICLHVRLQNKTNSFPINNLKGERISIDTTNKKSFKCLCKLINYYTVKKTLPNQKVKLAKAFQLQQRGSGVYDSCTEVSHL
ncbi:uncharacterized protein LOC110463368 [Mizuhopecten yessoensis]|uniref:uncharacterized protein LOC110463368 n=1 Tax=Mizuhopecten yessoensis TaxID=6573 RepID=UPI000B45CF4C|nr:uncharacterized protein LOC110463368 [Mizuhopecten yessoensis]XP_021373572.1 uncharacterized protein LOC110463368 [Mizuhopecten yessoensis]XP_021373573.1 uncharacterized protein LOC110463368 [Mizuhopecten yessoensis]